MMFWFYLVFGDLGGLGERWVRLWFIVGLLVRCVMCVSYGQADDEPESLILAQSERWRHA